MAALPLVMLSFGPAPLAYNFDDTAWHFSTAKVHLAGKAKGLGGLKHKEVSTADLFVSAGGLWSLETEAQEIMAGTWTVESVTDKSIDLVLDQSGADELRAWVDQQEEDAAAAKGTTVSVDLTTITSAKLHLNVKPNTKKGTARLKGSAVFKFAGTTDGNGITDAPTTAAYSFKGLTDEVPLSGILQ